MTLTCANCGYVNEAANETTANCPNCGAAYDNPTAHTNAPPPPPAFAPPFSGQPPARSAAGRRRGVIIGVGIAAVIVVLLAGGLVAYAATRSHPAAVATVATVTPTPTSGKAAKITFQTYTDPQGQFSLKYPSTWTTGTGTATIQNANVNLTTLLAKSAKGAITGGVIVAVGGSGLTLQNVGDVLTPNGLTGFTASGSPTTMTTKNGTTWQVVTGTATTAKGKTAKIAAAYAQHGTSTYLVIGFGGGKGGDKVFAAMLKSMTLGASA